MKFRNIISFVLAQIGIVFLSCCGRGTIDIDEWGKSVGKEDINQPTRIISVNDTIDHDWPADSVLRRYYSGVETALRRAKQLSELKWTPYAVVPSCYGYYSGSEEQTGAPYSLAYMTNTQLGTQVSLHTFMTALQNPYSVLYTEDLRLYPYNGSYGSSAVYYGTTCSNSVMYVLGIEPPYYTRMIGIIPGMKKTKEQTPEAIELCDVLWKSGHVMMVYGIHRDEGGNIVQVDLFETTTSKEKDTWIKCLSYKDFVSYWEKSGIVRYQYAYLGNNTEYDVSVFAPLDDEPAYSFQYNYDICPTLGDRCSYLEGKDVKLSVLSGYYSQIAIYKDGELFRTIDAKRPITNISGLPYGEYKACLVQDGLRSGYTYFEVINAEVESYVDSKIHIRFSSKNGSPRYLSICNENKTPYNYYSFKEKDRLNGYYDIGKINSGAATHFQVCFKGCYGVVATDVKLLEL